MSNQGIRPSLQVTVGDAETHIVAVRRGKRGWRPVDDGLVVPHNQELKPQLRPYVAKHDPPGLEESGSER